MAVSIVHRLDNEMRKRLLDVRKNGLKKGKWTGWQELYDHYTVKIGSTTYLVAPPTVGKTALIHEMVMNLAEYEGCKVCIFTPETGSPADVYSDLLWACMREPFFKHEQGVMSEKAVLKAIDFVGEHFFVLDPLHADLNESIYFNAINELQLEMKQKIDIAVIDPITDMQMATDQQRDLALGSFLTKVRKFSSTYDLHTFVAFHTKAMAMREGKDINGNNRRYYPPPTMGDVAGGEMAARKGMFILGLWRPPVGVIDPDTNDLYPRNETRVEILKAKPKALGKQGVVKLYYDTYSSRYYQMDDDKKVQWSYAKPLNIE